MGIINKKQFVVVALNADNETFVVHIAALEEPITIPIYPFGQAQIALLMSEETEIAAEYSDFSNIFFLALWQSYRSIPELIITLSIC